jgi:hypothetical protein
MVAIVVDAIADAHGLKGIVKSPAAVAADAVGAFVDGIDTTEVVVMAPKQKFEDDLYQILHSSSHNRVGPDSGPLSKSEFVECTLTA